MFSIILDHTHVNGMNMQTFRMYLCMQSFYFVRKFLSKNRDKNFRTLRTKDRNFKTTKLFESSTNSSEKEYAAASRREEDTEKTGTGGYFNLVYTSYVF